LSWTNTSAVGLKLYSDLVLSEKFGGQEDKLSGGKPGGIQKVATDEMDGRKSSGYRMENVSRSSDGSRIQARKTQVCFASNFEEEARVTFALPEDTSLTRVVRKVQTGELSGSYSEKCPCCIPPQQLCAERLHPHKWPKGRSGKSEHSFLMVSRSLRLNFTSTKSRYTNCQPRKINKV